MRFLLSAAILVLLVGCVNLATMLLARSKRRERDMATRIALGAPRVRLVRPLIIESLMLSLAGALLALGVTWWTFHALLRHVPALAYGGAPVGVSSRVMWFALALGGTAGLGFGVVPAWRVTSKRQGTACPRAAPSVGRRTERVERRARLPGGCARVVSRPRSCWSHLFEYRRPALHGCRHGE
jgi:putative ABC transport system permease protein